VAALVVFHGSVALAFAVAFGVSAATQLFNPAVSSLVPDLVAEDEIVTANSALWTAAVLAQIVLAPAAGILIATAGVAPAFAVNSISFTLSALVLRGLGGDGPSVGGDWRSLSGGFQAVRRHPLLRRLAVVQGLAALSAGATSGLLVVLAADWLHVGPSGFGILLAAIGVGAAAGPLLLRSRIRPGIRRWLFGPFLLRGAVDLILAGVPNAAVAAVALGFYGVGTSTGMVAYQSTLQTEVSSDVRGRVFVFFDVVWNVARLLSLGFGGAIADAIGIRVVYAIGGVLLIAAAGLGSLGRASAVK
jgi:predicted MFS family arabinose efflux permease